MLDHTQPLPQRRDSHQDGQLSSDTWRRRPSNRRQHSDPRASNSRACRHADAASAHHRHPHAPAQGAQPTKLSKNPGTAVQHVAQHLTAEREEPYRAWVNTSPETDKDSWRGNEADSLARKWQTNYADSANLFLNLSVHNIQGEQSWISSVSVCKELFTKRCDRDSV